MQSFNNSDIRRFNSETQQKQTQFRVFLRMFGQQKNAFSREFAAIMCEALSEKTAMESEDVRLCSHILIIAAFNSQNQLTPQQFTKIRNTLSSKNTGELEDFVIIWEKMQISEKISVQRAQEREEAKGWVSKIWDKILRFTNYKNFIDALLLYVFIRDVLLEPEEQLRRIVRVMLNLANKVNNQPLQLISLILRLLSNKAQFSFQITAKIEILYVIYISKMKKLVRNISDVKRSLELIESSYLTCLMDSMSRSEEYSSRKEEDIMEQKLFLSLLDLLAFWDQNQINEKIRLILIKMIRNKLDAQSLRQIIKQLSLQNEQNPSQKWKEIFKLLNQSFQIYNKRRECLIFQSSKSLLKRNSEFLPGTMIGLQFSINSMISKQEKILFQLQNKNKEKQLWITIRNYQNGVAIIAFVKLQNGIIWEKQQQYCTWNQFGNNTLKIIISKNYIFGIVNEDETKKIMIINYLDSYGFFLVGDEDNRLGTSIKTLQNFYICKCSSEKLQKTINLENHLWSNYTSRFTKKKSIPSFVQILKTLGDLDIFFLIISHILKKVKNQIQILEMIRLIHEFLQNFARNRKIKEAQTSAEQKKGRLNCILCLCWQSSHQNKSGNAIIQLMRLLSISNKKNYEGRLQILCNFVFWKQLDWQYQQIFILKIKKIFRQVNRDSTYENSHSQLVNKFSKRLLFQMVLFYKEENAGSALSKREEFLKLHHEFLKLIEEEFRLQIQTNGNQQIQHFYCDFMGYLLRLVTSTLNRRAQKSNMFDMTFSVQLSFLIKKMGQILYEGMRNQKFQIIQDAWTLGQDYLSESEPFQKNSLGQTLIYLISAALQICELYENEALYMEESKIKIYTYDQMGQQTFLWVEQSVVKENLYLFCYFISKLDKVLFSNLIQFHHKEGVSSILCLYWQKQFFQVLDQQENEDLLRFIQNMPLLSLSEQQMKKMFVLYLRNSSLFPHVNFTYSKYFCEKCRIHEFVGIIEAAFFNFDHEDKKYQISKINGTRIYSPLNVSNIESYDKKMWENKKLIYDKIINLLASNKQMTYLQAFNILQILIEFIPKNTEYLSNHLILNDLVGESKKMGKNDPVSELFIQSLSHIQSKFSECQVTFQGVQQLDREGESQVRQETLIASVQKGRIIQRKEIIECLYFFHTKINSYDLMELLSITNNEQAEKIVQNYKMNIQCILNNVSSCEYNRISQLKNFSDFLELELLQLSRFYLGQLNIIFDGNQLEKRRKRSHHGFLEFIPTNIKRQSEQLYGNFIDERNHYLLQVQKIWLKLQNKYKYFWNNFTAKEFFYSLNEITGAFHEKYVLKIDTKKPKLELPKMMKSSSYSFVSQKIELNQNDTDSSIFDDAAPYKKDNYLEESSTSQSNIVPPKKGKIFKQNHTHFRVMLITNEKIILGKLSLYKRRLKFKQFEVINHEIYDNIFANSCERRSEEDCVKENINFEINLNKQCSIVLKRYLFHDVALEIYCQNRSYFLCFKKQKYRHYFLSHVDKQIVIGGDKINEQMKFYTDKWENGIISNFQYLMKINDLVGRSFNDLSQYYVFPWTVINFSQQMNLKFFQNPQNFRNLAFPVGKLNTDKWQSIKKRYEMAKRLMSEDITMEPFMFGSFYSNPAIVCNYLIRLNPYSSHHFQLQSKQFDLADRLFFSVPELFKSCMNSPADFKELIPQFYFFPQFLKNRSAYNLGSRQNKDTVNNVALPAWARDELQFIFRMRKALQSEHVTRNLHNWIDLIFGIYAKRQNAAKADNLFLSNFYFQALEKSKRAKQKDCCYMRMFKEFGQMPLPIFNQKHVPCRFEDDFLDSLMSKRPQVVEYVLQKAEGGRLTHFLHFKTFNIFVFEKQLRLYEDEKFGERDYFVSNLEIDANYVGTWEVDDTDGKSHNFLIIQKRKTNSLECYEIKKNIWQRYVFESAEVLQLKHKSDILVSSKNFLFIADGKDIHIYRNLIQEQKSAHRSTIAFVSGRWKLDFLLQPPFIHHKAKIVHMRYCQVLQILISLDDQNKMFLVQLQHDAINIVNCFEIKVLYFEQKVVEMTLHNMGLIILRTDYDRLVITNFMGEVIAAKHILFQRNQDSTETVQRVTALDVWNHQNAQLVLGTNLGRLWKIDIFEMKRMEVIEQREMWSQKLYLIKEGFMREAIIRISVRRLGRHFLVLVFGQNGKVYSIKSRKFDEVKKMELLGKKSSNFW